MAAMKALVAAATIMLMIQLATATNFTVGAPGGSWNLNTNLATWATANTFAVGDNLIFSYSPALHNVLEVSKANYDSCTTSGAIKTYTSGNDEIPLPAAATRYFICGKPTHCANGMKVTINVVGAAATPAPTTSPTTPPPSGSTPAPTTTPTAASPSSGSTPAATSPGSSTPATPSTPSGAHNLQAKAAVGFGIGMLMFLAL